MKFLIDMDGVLCDFVKAAIRLHNLPIEHKDCSWDFFKQFFENQKDFWEPQKFEFWRDLPFHADGLNLLTYLMANNLPSNFCFCSTPTLGRDCVDGKIAWIVKWYPSMARQYMMTPCKDFAAHSNSLLIDDRDENVNSFIAAGGNAILIPRPWNKRKPECINGHEFSVQQIIKEVEKYTNA